MWRLLSLTRFDFWPHIFFLFFLKNVLTYTGLDIEQDLRPNMIILGGCTLLQMMLDMAQCD